ncbi:MAG: flagellar hook-length control protein FliK [Burkholderiales bacterium]|nr:flagellar hook-length control protein FliK [Burkholderiales bacterium]
MTPLNPLPLAQDAHVPQLRTASRLALLLDAMPGDGTRPDDPGGKPLVRGTTLAPAHTNTPVAASTLLAALASGDSSPAASLAQRSASLAAMPQLSEAARMLAQLGMRPRTPLELMLNFNRTEPDDAPASTGTAATASVQAPLADMAPEELATMLRSVITRSGLFYESHLSDWARGQRPLSDLTAQPQMRWQRDTASEQQGNPHSAITALAGSQDPATVRLAGVPEPLQELVSRQLDVLDSRQLHLHLITGAEHPVELMIGQERAHDAADTDAGTWVTELNCQLPELGVVNARLRLQGSRLAIALIAEDADRSDWLDARLGELRIMLERSGLPAPLLDVDHGDHP